MLSSSRASGRRPFFFTLYLGAAVLPALGHSDDDDEKGKKGYKFKKEDADDDSKHKDSSKHDWNDSDQDDGKWNDAWTSQDDGKWHASASASATEWSASESPTASVTTTKWHKSTDWSSLPSDSTSITSTLSSSSLALPTQPPGTPQNRHVNPVAIAVPLAICGLIGFIALLVCAKRRSAATRAVPGLSDIEKEMQSLMWRQQSLMSQKSDGVTVTKRVEDAVLPTMGYGPRDRTPSEDRTREVYEHPSRSHSGRGYTAHELAQHPDHSRVLAAQPAQPSERYHNLEWQHSDRLRAMDDYTHHPYHRAYSRYDQRPRGPPARHKSATESTFSDPTSRSDSCITPAHSRHTHDYFTHLPRTRSRYLEPSRSSSGCSPYENYPSRRSYSMDDCHCSRCTRSHDHKHSHHHPPTREPSLTSRGETESSLLNPHPRAKDPFDYYRPRSARPYDRYSHMERGHSGSSRAPSADGLYDSLRAALQSPR